MTSCFCTEASSKLGWVIDNKRLLFFKKQVRTEEELTEAIETATGAQKDTLCFIEVIVHKDDTSKELLEWGSRVSSANGRGPNPQ